MNKALRTIVKKIGIVLISLVVLGGVVFLAFNANPKHEIVRDVFIYGYPLVTMDMVRRQETNVEVPDGEHSPMGQILKMRAYPSVDNRGAAAPNADTLYTMVWLDVSDEPWVFSIPEMGDRFYIMPMLSAFNEVFYVAGQRATGGVAQKYAITGPGWSGELPEGVTQVESPTMVVWILGRVYCTGTPEDYAAVHALQDQFDSVPLSAYGKPYTPPPGVVDKNFDSVTAVRKQVNKMPLVEYFDYLAELLVDNPPKPEDALMLERFAEIGLVPGQDFDGSKLPIIGKKVDPKVALLEMVEKMKATKPVNGWLYWNSNAGTYGTDYAQRAMVTMIGPGLNFPYDAVYPFSEKDANGDDYDGSKYNYTVRFEKGQMPPVQGFWSLTMYDSEFFFVPNPLKRYNLSQRNTFVTNPDGSVDMYFQADSPGADKEANWLPAPEGKFILMLRLYWPTDKPPTILDNSWIPPKVERHERT